MLREATSVRVTRVGQFDPKHRKKSKPLFIESDPEALESLRGCFAIFEESLLRQAALMTPGDLDLNFLAGHDLITKVTYIFPDFLRWRPWGFDAKLVDGTKLTAWLVERGWKEPIGP